MKTPFCILITLLLLLSCREDEPSFSGVRCKLNGVDWIANEVIVESPQTGVNQVTKLSALDNEGFRIVFSLGSLGINANNPSVDFRKRSADLNYFRYQILGHNQVSLEWETETEESLFAFELEWSYSEDGGFMYYNTVYAEGWTSSPRKYESFASFNLSDDEVIYARLKLIDFNGDFVYSDVIRIQFSYPVMIVNRSGDRFEGFNGNITLSKYDVKDRVISGTFNFTYSIPGMQTVAVTEGVISNVQY